MTAIDSSASLQLALASDVSGQRGRLEVLVSNLARVPRSNVRVVSGSEAFASFGTAAWSRDPHLLDDEGVEWSVLRLRHHDDDLFGLFCVKGGSPLPNSLGELASLVVDHLNATALSGIDPLTGMANRRGFERAARQALAVAERREQPVTLFFLDLDGFKEVNDDFGHDRGDQILVEVADILRTVFRGSDVFGRLGGDEFCILATDIEDQRTIEPLARLADAFRDRNAIRGEKVELRYSTGVVSFEPHDGLQLDEVLRQADIHMYEHKARRSGAVSANDPASLLIDLALSLLETDCFESRMNHLCAETARLMRCDRSSIFLRRGDRHCARFNYGNPPDVEQLFPRFSVKVSDPLIAAAVERRSFITVNDVKSSALMNQETARIAGIQSIVVAPLFDGDDVIGFMTAEYNERPGVFDNLDAALIEGTARLATATAKQQPAATS